MSIEELNGFDKVDDIINEFLSRFDCEGEFNDEFCYWHTDSIIGYNLIIGTASDMAWTEYVNEVFDYSIKNIFVFSLLHEIGHHYTMDNFTKKKRNFEFQKVEKIEEELRESDDPILDKELYKQYFDLPMEKVATEWAVDYARHNETLLFYFWKKLERALKEFYKLNLDSGELPSMVDG